MEAKVIAIVWPIYHIVYYHLNVHKEYIKHYICSELYKNIFIYDIRYKMNMNTFTLHQIHRKVNPKDGISNLTAHTERTEILWTQEAVPIILATPTDQ